MHSVSFSRSALGPAKVCSWGITSTPDYWNNDYFDDYFRDGVKEAVKHSWYEYQGGEQARHPWDGQTNPQYTDFEDDGKYSWIKAPTFYDERVQVGPLANVLAMYSAGHEPTIACSADDPRSAAQALRAKLPPKP